MKDNIQTQDIGDNSINYRKQRIWEITQLFIVKDKIKTKDMGDTCNSINYSESKIKTKEMGDNSIDYSER